MTKNDVIKMIQKEDLTGDLAMDLGSAIAFDQISLEDVEDAVDYYCKISDVPKDTKRLFLNELYEYSEK